MSPSKTWPALAQIEKKKKSGNEREPFTVRARPALMANAISQIKRPSSFSKVDRMANIKCSFYVYKLRAEIYLKF
ncbi:hypothetical protein KFK09_001869 [Dendrobium nobile]|uniref:Uncharacterized protein n=1 Tax=Dendrobium nobile TaxID=94219 RepID=A0A8T3CC58_DENNO|nr:hypothetical protein KFK09_001869 [Dendrobium nobile]